MAMRNSTLICFILTIAILSLAISCDSSENHSTEAPAFAPMAMTSDAKSGLHTETMMRSEADFARGEDSSIAPDSEQMVIRRASLQIIVKDVQKTVKRIEDAAALLGGVVVSSNTSDNEASGISGSLQIRVPAEHLTTLLDAIKFDSIRVPHESVNSSDVTEEYIDLTARLENLELTESQLSKLMEKANTIEDILSVQRELTSIRGQIESLAGRVKYLETNVAMSTVHVAIYPEGSGKPITDPDWSITETIKDALRGLTDVGRFVVEVLIWIGILLPVWGTVGVIIVIGRRMIRKRRAGKQVAKEEDREIATN